MATMTLVQAEVDAAVDAAVVAKVTAVLADRGMNVSDVLGMLLERFVREESAGLQGEEDPEYDAWFRAKVQEAIDDPGPYISNEEAERLWAEQRAELIARAEAQERCA
jgi:DNA-damage-inducible protein J